MTFWTQPSEPAPSDGLDAIVEECEAFLTGRLAEHLIANRAPVPPWLWTNLLAHGSLSDLAQESVRRHRRWPRNRYQMWMEARSRLAGSILAVCNAYGPLPVMQEQAIRPLELALAESATLIAATPERWINQVEALLRLYQVRRLNAKPETNSL
ncbi:MAG TPA: hypothetical protein VL961_08425 [Acidimicrobiales bacterium]|nr:hypothetical protein [Acidimicrobiales bacterium]